MLIMQYSEWNYISDTCEFPLKPQLHDPSALTFNEMPIASCQGWRHQNHIILHKFIGRPELKSPKQMSSLCAEHFFLFTYEQWKQK